MSISVKFFEPVIVLTLADMIFSTMLSRWYFILKTFQNDFGDKAMEGYVVHPGDLIIPLGPNVTALPFYGL